MNLNIKRLFRLGSLHLIIHPDSIYRNRYRWVIKKNKLILYENNCNFIKRFIKKNKFKNILSYEGIASRLCIYIIKIRKKRKKKKEKRIMIKKKRNKILIFKPSSIKQYT